MFKAPRDWETYYDDVTNKSIEYIRCSYWEGLDKYELKAWLNNFKSNEEKYFSACLLDSLVFRSRKMVEASFIEIATSKIPKYLNSIDMPIKCDLNEWMNRLKKGDKIPFRFISMENIDKATGKSGAVIIRDLRKSLNIPRFLAKKPEEISSLPDYVKVIIPVDDFSGTGDQFIDFYKTQIDCNNNKGLKVLYTPLAAHSAAIDLIRKKHPEITMDPVEILNIEDSFFSPVDSFFRGDNENSINAALNFHKSLCEKNGWDTDEFLGVGKQSLTYAFYLSTPNNNLKLLYHNPDDAEWENFLHRNK